MKMRPLITLMIMSSYVYAHESVFPGTEWEEREPSEVGLKRERLESVAEYLGGRGFISRYGYQVFTWGDYTKREDIASAAKPFYTHFLLKAYETGKIPSLDEPLMVWEPRLEDLNADLCHKDRAITWRHVANQLSNYGVVEIPGTAFNYNDWQMALFWDTLFLNVYETDYGDVDEDVLRPILTDVIGCQDDPTMMAFGTDERPGRIGISPRDHARFGLLYLHRGNWDGEQVLREDLVRQAVTSPIPHTIPRAGFEAAEMIEGQRSIGAMRTPDNQTEHHGSYSWLWWINGVGSDGKRYWPDAPDDVFAALGHWSKRGLGVMPSLAVVITWNNGRLDQPPPEPHHLNEMFRLLMEAAEE